MRIGIGNKNEVSDVGVNKRPEHIKSESNISKQECVDYWNNFFDNGNEALDVNEGINKEQKIEGVDKELDEKEINGGAYSDVKKNANGETHEVHHMPADSASKLDRNDGPAIKMEKVDHKKTASCGNSREAREYRQRQRELIDKGEFRKALQMDIDDIREKFGSKYDDAISEMLEYVDKLEKEGII